MALRLLVPIFLGFFNQIYGQWSSSIVFEDELGRLRYVMDQDDNRIVDFSHAGYKNGEEKIPDVPSLIAIGPIAGDNTDHIQKVIDSISSLALDERGLRGAIVLEAGQYEIWGTLRIEASGVVLRGVGNSGDTTSNTILLAMGNEPNQRNVIEGGNSNVNWASRIAGSSSTIISDFVPVGSRTIEVGSPELYNIGDDIILFQPSNNEWLASIDFGATGVDAPWSAGEINIFYKRKVANINLFNRKLTLDVPIFDHLDKSLSTAEIYRIDPAAHLTNIGIENLRIDIATQGEMTEEHARNAIRLNGVEDCWIDKVTALHFIYAAVDMTNASNVTVKECNGLQPHSLITGARRYNFNVSQRSNNILFSGCVGSYGRHTFVSNGTSSASGIVWHNCSSSFDYSTTEGHRRWSQALLYDQITFTNPSANRLVGLYNRGSFGTGHGWASTHSVAWNLSIPNSASCVIQRPPSRQNYAIACQGNVNGSGPFSQPTGFIEGTNQTPAITSLYETQLASRLALDPAVDAPARFSIDQNATELVFTWLDIADNESAYVIEVSYDEGINYSTLSEIDANSTSYNFLYEDLDSERAHFRMFADSENYPSAYTHSVPIDLTVRARPIQDPKIKAFPNPASNILTIQMEEDLLDHVEIFSIDFKRKVLAKNQQKEFSVGHLIPGIYLLKIYLKSGESYLDKFIKL